MSKLRITQNVYIRFIVFAKYNEHCAPLFNHLHIVLFDDMFDL